MTIDPTHTNLPDWLCAYGGPSGNGDIKIQADDFIVEEILPFNPEGFGEHVFIFLEKCHENTEYVARLLARHAGVRQRDVSFAGLKDRHGRTRQWFSVWLPGREGPDWSLLASEHLTILQVSRHARKLKRGVLAGNQFTILIRGWQGDRLIAERQLQTIRQNGFPNYFGEQRFGRQGQNVEKALSMFAGAKVRREQRSIYLSAARSYLFNQILAERVRMQTWDQAIPGDIFKLNRSNSQFLAEQIDQALLDRLRNGDIQPTGALYGAGESEVSGDVFTLEQGIIAANRGLAEGLRNEGLEHERRSLRVIPENLNWQFETEGNLRLSFRLPAGSYATVLLREIADTNSTD